MVANSTGKQNKTEETPGSRFVLTTTSSGEMISHKTASYCWPRTAAQITILIHTVQTSDRQRFKAVMKFQQISKPVSFLCGEGAGGTRTRSVRLHCSRVSLSKNTVTKDSEAVTGVSQTPESIYCKNIYLLLVNHLQMYLCARSLKSFKTRQFLTFIIKIVKKWGNIIDSQDEIHFPAYDGFWFKSWSAISSRRLNTLVSRRIHVKWRFKHRFTCSATLFLKLTITPSLVCSWREIQTQGTGGFFYSHCSVRREGEGFWYEYWAEKQETRHPGLKHWELK